MNKIKKIHLILHEAFIDRPKGGSVVNLIKMASHVKSDWEAVKYIQYISNTLEQCLDFMSQTNIDSDMKKEFTKSLSVIIEKFKPDKLHTNLVGDVTLQSAIGTLVFLSGNDLIETVYKEDGTSFQEYASRIEELEAELSDAEFDDEFELKLRSVLTGCASFLSSAEVVGADVAWTELSALLMMLARDCAHAKTPKQKSLLRRLSIVTAGAIATMATVNTLWDETNEFLGHQSEARQLLIDAINGEVKLIADGTKKE
jgi:hypothetical protein